MQNTENTRKSCLSRKKKLLMVTYEQNNLNFRTKIDLKPVQCLRYGQYLHGAGGSVENEC